VGERPHRLRLYGRQIHTLALINPSRSRPYPVGRSPCGYRLWRVLRTTYANRLFGPHVTGRDVLSFFLVGRDSSLCSCGGGGELALPGLQFPLGPISSNQLFTAMAHHVALFRYDAGRFPSRLPTTIVPLQIGSPERPLSTPELLGVLVVSSSVVCFVLVCFPHPGRGARLRLDRRSPRWPTTTA